ncbi:MAG: hypothetical protein V5A38_01695 [Halolamina sp.]|uniref:hypothetical protein n=1 Tax=Halolamina sp. TaxID=1940283 RepID=UPI002FC36473
MVLTAVNAILLLVLVGVWVRNYREFRSTMVLGLVGFGSVLLLENLVGLYFFFGSMTSLYGSDPVVGMVLLGMRGLQFVAIAFLTYATVK